MDKTTNRLNFLKYAIALFLISLNSYAGDNQNNDTVNNYYEATNNYNETTAGPSVLTVSDEYINKGIALALATNHPFDYATNKWQGSINASYYEGQNALSMGLAKRFKKMDALWHTSISGIETKTAVTLGAVWRF